MGNKVSLHCRKADIGMPFDKKRFDPPVLHSSEGLKFPLKRQINAPFLFEKNTFVGLLYGAKIVRKSSTLHHRLDRIVDFF